MFYVTTPHDNHNKKAHEKMITKQSVPLQNVNKEQRKTIRNKGGNKTVKKQTRQTETKRQ